jgi:hypothetical protein
MTNFAASFANLGISLLRGIVVAVFFRLGPPVISMENMQLAAQSVVRKPRKPEGPCCSVADGQSVEGVDWDTKDGNYRVRLDGQWIEVPPDAL